MSGALSRSKSFSDSDLLTACEIDETRRKHRVRCCSENAVRSGTKVLFCKEISTEKCNEYFEKEIPHADIRNICISDEEINKTKPDSRDNQVKPFSTETSESEQLNVKMNSESQNIELSNKSLETVENFNSTVSVSSIDNNSEQLATAIVEHGRRSSNEDSCGSWAYSKDASKSTKSYSTSEKDYISKEAKPFSTSDRVAEDEDVIPEERQVEILNSSPYFGFEEVVNNRCIIGEPRCVALKKNVNNDESLVLDVDVDDDLLVYDVANPKDMFCDREEGELSSDLGHSDVNETNNENSKKTRETNIVALKPLKTVDDFLRQMENDCNMLKNRNPSQNIVDRLKRTLIKVESIKKTLSKMVDNVSSACKSSSKQKPEKKPVESNEREKTKARSLDSRHRRHSKSSKTMETISTTKSKRVSDSGKDRTKADLKEKYSTRGNSSSVRKDTSKKYLDTNSKQLAENLSDTCKDSEKKYSRESERTSLHRRIPSNPESMVERQRIQSLFKRQMNLINQHVVQKKEVRKCKDNVSKINSKATERDSSPNADHQNNSKKDVLGELKTLEDMEAFLHVLKERKDKKQGVLTFTSKRDKAPVKKKVTDFDCGGLNVSNETRVRKLQDKTKEYGGTTKITKEIKDSEKIETKIQDLEKVSDICGKSLIGMQGNKRVGSPKNLIHSSHPHQISKKGGLSANISIPGHFDSDIEEIQPTSVKRKIDEKQRSRSDSEEKIQLSKKKRVAESSGELSSGEMERDGISNAESGTRRRSENKINDFARALKNQRVVLVGSKKFTGHQFCLKVIGNQVYLKKVGRRRPQSRSSEPKSSRMESEKSDRAICPKATSLEEMEEFLRQLRRKRRILEQETSSISVSNSQSREAKFMARIQAKRKAKLMACLSNSTEKEAKILKVLEKRDSGDSPDTEQKKRKLIQKIKAETDAILLAQNEPKNVTKPPVERTLMQEDCNSKQQTSVSFSLKKSDSKQLENNSGEGSTVTEESQRLLNNMRAKMKAKKIPVHSLNFQKPND